MAVITRGKHKGREVEIRQFCNDWFSFDHPEIPNRESIINPASLSFTPEEKQRIEEAEKAGRAGIMFKVFYWDGLTLKKKKFTG